MTLGLHYHDGHISLRHFGGIETKKRDNAIIISKIG
jgi:hypothetical protein